MQLIQDNESAIFSYIFQEWIQLKNVLMYHGHAFILFSHNKCQTSNHILLKMV